MFLGQKHLRFDTGSSVRFSGQELIGENSFLSHFVSWNCKDLWVSARKFSPDLSDTWFLGRQDVSTEQDMNSWGFSQTSLWRFDLQEHKRKADSSWDIWWYLRYSTVVDFMRFGHWIPGISSRRSQCWPKDFVSQKLVQYQADVWKYFPSLWCKVAVSNTFSLIGWCRMTFHLDPKDSSILRHRRLVRWRSSMAKDLLKDLWAIRLSRRKMSNDARHECHYEAQTRYVCWQIQKPFAFSRCTIYHQSVLQAVFERVLSCALLHLPMELLALEELVVATAVQELSLSTFDGLLGLGLPGIAHVQQDPWDISKNTMQRVTGYHMVL